METQPIDPLQLLLGKHVAYIDSNQATRVGKLKAITKSGNCTIEQQITLVKQKNGHRYPSINHRIERKMIIGSASHRSGHIIPLDKTNKKIIKKADENGIEIKAEKMIMPKEKFNFTKKITATEIKWSFLVVGAKLGLNIGDPLTVKLNGYRVNLHVGSAKRLHLGEYMKKADMRAGDVLNFDVLKSNGNTIVTIEFEKKED